MNPLNECRSKPTVQSLTSRIARWVLTTFGDECLASRTERAARIVEEAAELAQTEGVPLAQLHAIAERVYSRPVGNPGQEAAGVTLTLLAWGHTAGEDVLALADTELHRIESGDVDHFRKKHAAKVAAGTTTIAGTE